MDKYLSWFIGPKAENADNFKKLINIIIQDNYHWRKNYFSKDPSLINNTDKRNSLVENDKLLDTINEFLALLGV